MTSKTTTSSGQDQCIRDETFFGWGKKQKRTLGDFGRLDDNIKMDLKRNKF
jgi:hypothetical protein